MKLLVDIGNSYTKIRDESNSYNIRFKTKELNDSFLLSTLLLPTKYDKAIISSVVKDKDTILSNFLLNKYSIPSFIISKDIKCRIEYPKENNELGSDLISLMEGIKDESFIAFSLGTASVCVLVLNNKFMGCAIAPGVLTSLEGLFKNASLIDRTIIDKNASLLGSTTKDALSAGLINTFSFMVDGYINEIKEKYNLKDINSYIAGGYSLSIESRLKNKVIVDRDLIFKGLLELARLNNE